MKAKKSVCIIDDDKVYTFGVKILKTLIPGDNVTTYENGKKAIDGLRSIIKEGKEFPDLILLDIDMPEMNGWDFLNEFERIRPEVKKNIKIFVISSRIDPTKEELYKVEWDAKVSDFIKKPVQIDSLKALIE